MSLVTVIVPVAEPHRDVLPRALYSLQQQTYSPDILVVNDAPSPLTLGDIMVVPTGGNKGSAYSRNLGLDHVKTPLVTFLDADDFFLDNALELLTKAYLEYDTCYVYGDWYQYGKNGQLKLYTSKIYDRKRQLRHSIHLVNILLATDTAKSVYYDINYRGWEDWAFHIELGQRGFCGTRVPEPVLIYDMTTSINREKHNAIQDEVYNEILDKYGEYLRGEKEFMACTSCGSNRRQMANPFVATPPAPQEGMVTMEYMGQNTGAVSFRVGQTSYKGANDESFKYINVPAAHVNALMERGPWRRMPKAAAPAKVPEPQEFENWRKVNQTPMPQNWETLFKRDAEVIATAPSNGQIVVKRKGRPKGAKNKPKEETVETTTV